MTERVDSLQIIMLNIFIELLFVDELQPLMRSETAARIKRFPAITAEASKKISPLYSLDMANYLT